MRVNLLWIQALAAKRRKPWVRRVPDGKSPEGAKVTALVETKKSRDQNRSRQVLAGCPDKLCLQQLGLKPVRILSCADAALKGPLFHVARSCVSRIYIATRFFAALPSDPAPGSGCSTSASRSAARRTAATRR